MKFRVTMVITVAFFSVSSLPEILIAQNVEATLFAPFGNKTTYLIDENGDNINTWESDQGPALSVYLLEDSTLLKTTSDGLNSNSVFTGVGGAGGKVERFDWDGNKIWEFSYNSDEYLLHHDIEYLPNGNILMIAWEYKSQADALNAGRDPDLLEDNELWPDKIIEVNPNKEIVWEWKVWDHLVQDFDDTKENYGTVSEQPGKINLNFIYKKGEADWNHLNAIDYNEELDQILLTSRSFSEVWVIDHNTTTEEAAGSAGDLLYRWGNPQTYDQGTSADQKLFIPHDGQWIETGLPGEDDILIFNNGTGRTDGDYSTVDQFTPPLVDSEYILESNTAFGPETTSWTYKSSPTSDFYAKQISGAQRLSNGNTLICEGTSGTFFEVTDSGETVWEYVNPYTFSNPDGDVKNEVFRAVRYTLKGNDDPDTPGDLTFPIVDTGQDIYFNLSDEISAPKKGEDFYGQDANYQGIQPSYTISDDELTVYDNVTGLTWTKSPDWNSDGKIDYDDKFTFSDAQEYPENTLNPDKYAGYNDWRLPSMKELYSIMNFLGNDASGVNSADGLLPFVDTDYFDFNYGDEDAGERIIDSQFWSDNEYVGKVFGTQSAAFGLNLADGRIKGYPISGEVAKLNYVYFVRGNTDYGVNKFTDNEDQTITDSATGLMWMKDDKGNGTDTGPRSGITWQDALEWAEAKNAENYLGYDDWRLPNAKELHSILDYSRAPGATSSAAIDPIFNTTKITNEAGEDDYPWFWTSTTHIRYDDLGINAVYICFGRATGNNGGESWLDVHGAGAQRSGRKEDDFSEADYTEDGYSFGGPQGDAARIFNYVRLVRDADEQGNPTNTDQNGIVPSEFGLSQNYPNPFNPTTTIEYQVKEPGNVKLTVFNLLGQEVQVLVNKRYSVGTYAVDFDASELTSGIYFYRLEVNDFTSTKRMMLIK